MGVPWWFFIWIPIVVLAPIVFRLWFRRKSLTLTGPVVYPVMMPAPAVWGQPPVQPPPVRPTHIKKTPCRNCGALKVTTPKTACLYCDFCGTLVDWDLRMSMAAGSAQPARELNRLMYMVGAQRSHALATQNREAYRQMMMGVWQQHMASCPSSYSPRIGDPAYRQALLAYLCLVDTEIGFDPQSQQLEQAVVQARNALPRQPGPMVHPQALGHLVAAKKASLDRAVTLISPHLHLHPDEPTPELAKAVMSSSFVQAILRYLDPAQQTWLIDEMGLGGEYAPIAPVESTERHCGKCGGSVACVQGASRVLCEACGHFNDVSRAELACPECGGTACIPIGTHQLTCPYCRADMRVG